MGFRINPEIHRATLPPTDDGVQAPPNASRSAGNTIRDGERLPKPTRAPFAVDPRPLNGAFVQQVQFSGGSDSGRPVSLALEWRDRNDIHGELGFFPLFNDPHLGAFFEEDGHRPSSELAERLPAGANLVQADGWVFATLPSGAEQPLSEDVRNQLLSNGARIEVDQDGSMVIYQSDADAMSRRSVRKILRENHKEWQGTHRFYHQAGGQHGLAERTYLTPLQLLTS